ncbi:hypothetical protein [Methylophaga sp.]|jgi:predicted nucleic acid-binding protein|uniref:hypothetical protein n=1 Tax=Methylophaga sp. TaxID=2024840 RepID=UPI001400A8CC|nr:hypothetical protein [Methylophaga sp.]MTI63875.1 hypothetical protein [Methylophaga sp.]
MISEELKKAESIEEVVQIIDNGGTGFETPEEVAAKYAYLSAMQTERHNKEDIQAELQSLMEEGAMFEYPLALEYAESYLIDTLTDTPRSERF